MVNERSPRGTKSTKIISSLGNQKMIYEPTRCLSSKTRGREFWGNRPKWQSIIEENFLIFSDSFESISDGNFNVQTKTFDSR